MRHPRFLLLLPLAAQLLAPALCAQSQLLLRTRDVTVRVAASREAPVLLAVESTGAANAWSGNSVQALISEVEAAGVARDVQWQLDASATVQTPRLLRLVYRATQPALRLEWEWEARAAAGPIEHRVRITNLSPQELWLPLQPSLTFDWSAAAEPLTAFSVEKGADTPSRSGEHRDPLPPGTTWYGESSTYAMPRAGHPREIIPYVAVLRHDGRGFFAGVEFSGRLRLLLQRDRAALHGTIGLDPVPGPFRTRLAPGETFETPTVFVSTFAGGEDGAANQLHRWERRVLGNPNTWSDPHYPVLVSNSWGSGVEVDEPLALRMIDDAAELGLEMFHLDAGWFRGIGDWEPDPVKFPHGLAYVADAAHRRGLRFGMWIDWVQAGASNQPGALNVRDPKVANWMVTDLPAAWKPESYKGQTLDLGVPAVRDWAQQKLEHVVTSNKLDMLEHDGYLVAKGCARADHPHAAPGAMGYTVFEDAGFRFVEGDNETDVSYHATRNYYAVHSKLRRDHPHLLFEICNDGGRMVDFGALEHGDYFSATDTYDPLSNRRAVYDATYLIPAPMLESYVESWPTPTLDVFRFMLRSGMMGWMSVMTDTTKWTPEQHAAAKSEIEFYKQTLRPLLRDADVFHVGPRPDNVHWDGLEYYDRARGRGVLFAFRGSQPEDAQFTFVLKGLDPAARYTVRSRDGRFAALHRRGAELMRDGVTLRMAAPYSSDIVLVEREAAQKEAPAR